MFEIFMSFPVYIQAFLAALLTWGITALGASLVFFFKKVNHFVLDLMMSLSAGVMIAASFWSLLNPAIERANEMGMISWLVVLIGFVFGASFLFLGDVLFEKLFTKKNIKAKHGIKRCSMLMFSMTLHNIPEGLAIGVAFGSLASGYTDASLMAAIMLAVGIGIQNFPEGCAVSLPLRREGLSRSKSFMIAQISGIVEPISAIFGALLVMGVSNIMPYFLAFAAGAMLYVVVEELIPESQANEKKNMMSLFTLLGFAIMMVLDVALG